jgi:hypothetical protein
MPAALPGTTSAPRIEVTGISKSPDSDQIFSAKVNFTLIPLL